MKSLVLIQEHTLDHDYQRSVCLPDEADGPSSEQAMMGRAFHDRP